MISDIWKWEVFLASAAPLVLLQVEVVNVDRCTSQGVPLEAGLDFHKTIIGLLGLSS